MATCADPNNCYAHHHGIDGTIAKVRHDMRKLGWSVVVLQDSKPFAYTVGLTGKKLPELYIQTAGMSTRGGQIDAQHTLNAISTYLLEHKDQARHTGTAVIRDHDGMSFTYLLETRLNTKPLTVANKIFNGRFRVLEAFRLN